VITGLGVVTHAGSGIDRMWAALAEAAPAGLPWSPDEGEPFFCAPVPDDYRPNPGIPRNLQHFMDRGSIIALDAALQALEDAGIAAGAGDARRFAVADGLAYRAPGQATLFVPYGHLVARALGVRGPVVETGGAEASGMAAIAAAARLVRDGRADVVIAGAGQSLQRPLLEHVRGTGMASRAGARPFDREAGGFLAAEGAAYLVVEAEGHAAGRGARVRARISGTGEVFDGLAEPLASPSASEVGRAMQDALTDAGFIQNQVDLLVSCADGRPELDRAEAIGALRTFGRHAYFAGVTAPAGALGNTLAASGPLAVAAALAAMERQASFPIGGFDETPEKVELNLLKAGQPERIDCVLVTAAGLGGTLAALLLHR
jgi:3-oxoacyl-(acyl-carrier-protein) synthase